VSDEPILVFDGDCGFCTSSAQWVEEHARTPIRVVPWQRLDLEMYGLTSAETSAAAWWIDAHGRKFRGHLAVGHALLMCGRGWRLLGRLFVAPPFSWLASVVYRVVTRYRYRLPGGTPACRVDDRNQT
jgi:predicted DCC family thiol-disulfide oxidoreductase YuxK